MDAVTRTQLESLEQAGKLASPRPLLICDVDEVVLHLVSPFEQVLAERGWELRTKSFRLTGNVFHRETGAEATQDDVWSALEVLFTEQATRQGPVEGAVENLNTLEEVMDVIYLTNLPHDFADVRREHMRSLGLAQPLVSNTGSKSNAIGRLKRERTAFIDDTPLNLTQTRETHPDVHVFHFMADETFRSLVDPIDGVEPSRANWNETADAIRERLLA